MAVGIASMITGVVSGVGDAVTKVAGVFGSNKEADAQRAAAADDRDANLILGAQRQFAAEFHKPTNWFDSLINGINRLPRPAMALSALALLWYAFLDPIRFTAGMTGLTLVPDLLWTIVAGVFAFYFGGRWHIERRKLQVTADQAKHVVEAIKDIKKLQPPPPEPPAVPEGTPHVGEHENAGPEVEEADLEDNPAAVRLAGKAKRK